MVEALEGIYSHPWLTTLWLLIIMLGISEIGKERVK